MDQGLSACKRSGEIGETLKMSVICPIGPEAYVQYVKYVIYVIYVICVMYGIYQ